MKVVGVGIAVVELDALEQRPSGQVNPRTPDSWDSSSVKSPPGPGSFAAFRCRLRLEFERRDAHVREVGRAEVRALGIPGDVRGARRHRRGKKTQHDTEPSESGGPHWVLLSVDRLPAIL